MQSQLAASALSTAIENEAARLDAESVRQTLRHACQVQMSSRLRIEHPGAVPMDVPVDRPYMLIGSDPSCDVQLIHDDVDPQHSYLQWINGHLFCCDIGQRSTLVRSRHHSSTGQWVAEEPYEVGPFRLTLTKRESEPPGFHPLERCPELANEFPLLAFQFKGVEQAENVWPINRVLTMIGRGRHCKLRLNHDSIAYSQACLLRTGKGCWLIDLLKSGATRVNDRPIEVRPIDVGDEIELGMFRMEVISQAAPTAHSNGQPASRKAAEKNRSRPASDNKSAKTRTNLDESQIVEFLKEQQLELADLKKQLDSLTQNYDSNSEQQADIERPVRETLERHDAIYRKLSQYLQDDQ